VESFKSPTCQALRAKALTLPEVTEGTSCVNRAFKARKKNFLFLGEKVEELRVMVKLTGSLAAADAMNDPRIEVGKFGWVTLRFAPGDAPDAELLGGWVVESYRALAPKTLVKRLDARGG
jgi:hypothetical protein